VRLLLDTHTFLWFLADDPQLSPTARSLIEDGTNEILLSMASLWEIAIKVSLGKLTLGGAFATFIPDQLTLNAFGLLPIELAHVTAVAALPFHHRDPFDRLLVAQALVEPLPIISRDPALDAYGVTRKW
jgi:PIN domain nuclease of toxin-antitoxin system